MTLRALILNPADNVANLLGAGTAGQPVQCAVAGQAAAETITLLEDIPSHHKLARRDIPAGQEIVKYGLSIGRATVDIRQGQCVHVHNVESHRPYGHEAARDPATIRS